MSQNFIFCRKLKDMYENNCNEFEIAKIEEATLYYFIPLLSFVSFIIFFKRNRFFLYEILFRIGYGSFLVTTKILNICKRVKKYFSYRSINNNINNEKIYIYDEVKVIKNGVRCASFETMETFKDSNYLGNPNEYYDLNETSVETSSSSFDSELVDTMSSSSSALSSPSQASVSSSSSSSYEPEPLFIMEKNESDNTLEFRTFDFIFHTMYMYPESIKTSKQNYTKIYRTFTENEYNVDKNNYNISNTEMIVCNLEIDGDETEYEIDLSKPYNFNVVGNLILDEKFVTWYILKKYNYTLDPSVKYKITCITNSVKTFQIDRSCGLRVNINDYEMVRQQ